MRPALATLALLAAVATPVLAGAQDTAPPPAPARGGPPPKLFVELDFSVGPGARRCPALSYLHGELARRIGYDPFDAASGGTPAGRLNVKIAASGDATTATYTYVDPAGKPVWSKPRTYTEEGTGKESCEGVLQGIAVEFAWEFPFADGPEPTPQPPPRAAPAPEAPTTKPAAPVVEPEKAPGSVTPATPVRGPIEGRVGVGARVDFGSAGTLFGVTLEVGVQRRQWGWGGWSLTGALRWAPPQTGIGPPTAGPSVDVSSSLVAGRLAGCVYRAWAISLAGCVVGELGEIQQSAGGPSDQNKHQTALFAGGGLGAHIQVPLTARVHVQMETDVLGVATLAGTTNQVTNVFARNFGGAAGGLGASLGLSF